MTTKSLTYVLGLKDNFTPGMRKAGKEAEKSGGKITGSMHSAGLAFAGLGTVAIGTMAKMVSDARGLNLAPLKQAAVNAGIAWKAFKPQIDAAGTSMAKVGFTQGQTNDALTKLVTITGSSSAALGALGTAADLARYKHISLTDASLQLGKAATGDTRALKELGISTADLPKHFATTGTEASRLSTVMGLLNPKISGQAAAAANTMGGKLGALKAQATNLSAGLGAMLIPMLSSVVSALTSVLAPVMQNKAAFATLGIGVAAFAVVARIAMASFAAGAKAALVTSVVGIAILALSVAITELMLHWNTVWNVMKGVINGFRNVMVGVLKVIVDYFLWWGGMIINTAAKAFGWIPGYRP